MIGDIRKFRFWCQKVLPLVYDDSLSYYEILCKVVQYLNKVIEDVNSIPDYIDGVIDERLSDEHLQELIEMFVRQIEDAISSNNEGNNTNSSADYNIGQMLWLNGILYRVIRQIDAGDTFIVDTNIEAVHFEDMFTEFIEGVKNDICNNDDGLNSHASRDWSKGDWLWLDDELYIATKDIPQGVSYIFEGANMNVKKISVNEEADVVYDGTENSLSIHGRVNGSNTFIDKVSVEEADGNKEDVLIRDSGARSAIDTITGDITTIVGDIDAIETRVGNVETNIGSLEDLTTEDKTNLVNAINEIDRRLGDLPFFNVKNYGAVGDGVTDDSDAIQTLINSVEEGTIFFPHGTYLLGTTLRVHSNITLTGENGSVLKCTDRTILSEAGAASVGVLVLGSTEASQSATQTSMTDFTITVENGSAFTVGDLVELYSDTQKYSIQVADDGPYVGYLAIVQLINGNTITLDHAPYSLLTNGHIRKVNAAENVTVNNLTIVGLDEVVTRQHGLFLRYCRNARVENCNFKGFEFYTIGIVSCCEAFITKNNIIGTYYNGVNGNIFYGIACVNDCYKIIVQGNLGYKVRHLFVNVGYTGSTDFVGAPVRINVIGNNCIGCMAPNAGASYAYEHHGVGLYILFDGNIADSCYSGFNIEGSGVTITNNIITNWLVNAISVGDGLSCSYINISNNLIKNFAGANFTGTQKAAILLDSSILSYSIISGFIINDNNIYMETNEFPAIMAKGSGVMSGVIRDNSIHGASFTTAGAYAIDTRDTSYQVSIIGNHIEFFLNGINSNSLLITDNDIISTVFNAGVGIETQNPSAVVKNNSIHSSGIGVKANGNVKLMSNYIASNTPVSLAGSDNYTVGNYPASVNS